LTLQNAGKDPFPFLSSKVAAHRFRGERDVHALVLVCRSEHAAFATLAGENGHDAAGVALVREGFVGPVLALIVAEIEILRNSTDADDEAVRRSGNGSQDSKGQGRLHRECLLGG